MPGLPAQTQAVGTASFKIAAGLRSEIVVFAGTICPEPDAWPTEIGRGQCVKIIEQRSL
jgi:hypothetical protein